MSAPPTSFSHAQPSSPSISRTSSLSSSSSSKDRHSAHSNQLTHDRSPPLLPSLMSRPSHQSTDSTSTTASSQSSHTNSSNHHQLQQSRLQQQSKLPRFLRNDKKSRTSTEPAVVLVQGASPRQSLDGGGEPAKPAKKLSRSRTLARKISESRLFSHPESSSSSSRSQSSSRRPDPTSLTSPPREMSEDHDSDSLLLSSPNPSDPDPMIIVDPPPPPSLPSSSSHPPRTRRATSSPTTSSTSSFHHNERVIRESSSPSRPLSTVNYTSGHPTAPNGDSPYNHSNNSSSRLGEIASAIPTRLGGWFSNLIPTNSPPTSNSSSSTTSMQRPTSYLDPSPSPASYPIPPSLHASHSTNQSRIPLSSVQSPPKAQRSVLTAAREKGAIMRYLLDPDASRPERCEEGIWVMGKLHDGWRPLSNGEDRESLDAGQQVSKMTSPPRKRASKGSAGAAAGLTLASPTKFINIFSTSSLSLSLGARDSDDTSSRDRKTKDEVRWPEQFLSDFQSNIWCTYRSQYAPIVHLPPHLLVPSPSSYDSDGLPLPSLVEISRESNANQPVIPKSQSGWSWVRSGTSDEKGLTTDSGWGCMLRTGQSLLANSLIYLHLGRDWRRPPVAPDPSTSSKQELIEYATYVKIISWFLDDPLPYAPFSVHRMALVGKQLGKEIGEWFGPSTAAGAIKTLVNAYPHAGLSVSLASDSVIFRSDVFAASRPAPNPSSTEQTQDGRKSSGKAKETTDVKSWGGHAVLVLVGVRLGLDGVNPIYHETVKNLFTFPQSVGIAGGRPSSSYYFLGYQADSLFYLDPHHTRPAVILRQPPSREELERQLQEDDGNREVPNGSGEAEADGIVDSTELDGDAFDTPESSISAPSPNEPIATLAELPIPHPTHPSRTEFPPLRSLSTAPPLDPLQRWYATAYPAQSLQTFHCEKVRRMAFNQLDPSMLLGFLCKDEADWEDFQTRVANMPNAIFSIVDEPSGWDDTDDAGLESFSETDPDDDDIASASIASTTPEDTLKEEDECDGSETSIIDGDLPTPLRHARQPIQPKPRRRESVLSFDDDDDDDELSAPLDDSSVFASPGEMVEREELGLPVPSPSTNPDSASLPSLPRRQPPPATSASERPKPARALGSEFELLGVSDWTESPPDRPTSPLHQLLKATNHRPSTAPSTHTNTHQTSPPSSSSATSSPPTPSRRISKTPHIGGHSSRRQGSSSGRTRRPAQDTREEEDGETKIGFPRKSGEEERYDVGRSGGPKNGSWSGPAAAAGGRKGGLRNFSGATLRRLEDDDEDDF